MPPGFLAVASQPSTKLPLEEFHAWYEEEHIPLRLNRLPSFLSGARYSATDMEGNANTDETRPGWLAMYEIDDTKTFADPSYTGLRLQRSEREKDVMSRLKVLTRDTGEVLGVWGENEGLEETRTTGLKVGKPSPWIITHGIEIGPNGEHAENTPDSKAKRWGDEVAQMMKVETNTNGWVRTRVVKVLEKGMTKMGVNAALGKEQQSSNYFIVHEFSTLETSSREVSEAVFQTCNSQNLTVGNWRTWKLYKVYPCIAQGHVQL